MICLLDTNVLSEGMKAHPDSKVIEWLDAHQEDSAISALTLAELARGAEAVADGKRKNELLRLLRFMQEDFADAILPFDEATAWGGHATASALMRKVVQWPSWTV